MPYLTIRNNRYTQQLNVLWLHSVNVPSVYTQIYILWSAYTWKIANKYHLFDIVLNILIWKVVNSVFNYYNWWSVKIISTMCSTQLEKDWNTISRSWWTDLSLDISWSFWYNQLAYFNNLAFPNQNCNAWNLYYLNR